MSLVFKFLFYLSKPDELRNLCCLSLQKFEVGRDGVKLQCFDHCLKGNDVPVKILLKFCHRFVFAHVKNHVYRTIE